jgi:hypothetical protein
MVTIDREFSSGLNAVSQLQDGAECQRFFSISGRLKNNDISQGA